MTVVETIYPLADKRVWVAGHRGMVGGAILRRMQARQAADAELDPETAPDHANTSPRWWRAR